MCTVIWIFALKRINHTIVFLMSFEDHFNYQLDKWLSGHSLFQGVECILIDDAKFSTANLTKRSFSLYLKQNKNVFSDLIKLLVVVLEPDWIVQWKYLYDPGVENIHCVDDVCTCPLPPLSTSTDLNSWCENLISYLSKTLLRSFLSNRIHSKNS